MTKAIRWLPKFSLRFLLLAVVVVAIPSAYLGLPVSTYYRESRIVQQLESLGGNTARRIIYTDASAGVNLKAATWWGYQKFFARVVDVDLSGITITDEHIAALSKLKALRSLNLTDTNVNDTSVKVLLSLPRLNSLNLSGTHVTDAAWTTLRRLKELYLLDLSNTAVTDKVLGPISELAELNTLRTRGTAVSLTQLGKNFDAELYKRSFDERIGELGYFGGGTNKYAFWLTSTTQANQAIEAVRMLGQSEDRFVAIGFASGIATNDLIERVASLPCVWAIHLDSTAVTDEGLSHMKDNKWLRRLEIYNASISPQLFAQLDEQKNLELVTSNIQSPSKRSFFDAAMDIAHRQWLGHGRNQNFVVGFE